MEKNFDYIIIGAGSAGCVLANRLSSSTKDSIALFEAGTTSNSWKIDMPSALLYAMHDPKMNWKYYSEPEPFLNNRQLFCPRGKMIGGCSSHNGMVFVRGHPEDFNRWASYDLPSWSYANVLPYFKKLETWSEGTNLYRGGKGPLKVSKSKINKKFPLFQKVLDAAKEAGFEGKFDNLLIDQVKRIKASQINKVLNLFLVFKIPFGPVKLDVLLKLLFVLWPINNRRRPEMLSTCESIINQAI